MWLPCITHNWLWQVSVILPKQLWQVCIKYPCQTATFRLGDKVDLICHADLGDKKVGPVAKRDNPDKADKGGQLDQS